MTQSTDSRFTLHQGNNIDVLRDYPDNHFDSVVTDPPYGIDFLGKDWDSHTGSIDTYKECLRVLKPGGHLLAFSAARTYHHLAMSVELAGFEIRDQIMWVYSSGFPKSQDVGKSIDRSAKKVDPKYTGSKKKGHNLAFGSAAIGGRPCGKCGKDDTHKSICEDTDCGLKYTPQTEEGKQWSGWGTALKPAHEPIVVARKPAKVSIAKNVQIYGVGALNINACRVEVAEDEKESFQGNWDRVNAGMAEYDKLDGTVAHGAAQLDDIKKDISGYKPEGRFPSNVLGELGEYQKYFYCPKVSRKERHAGFADPGPLFPGADGGGREMLAVRDALIANDHTKVSKPLPVDEPYDKAFYCPKVSRKERHAGFEDPGPLFSGMSKAEVVMGGMLNSSDKNKTNTRGDVEKRSNIPQPITGHIKGCYDENGNRLAVTMNNANGGANGQGNNHPTVKPQALMEYLIRLVTPPGSKVLDPFNGSGSTGMAAVKLGHHYTGIDLDEKYIEISSKRITAWNQPEEETNNFKALFDETTK